MTNNKQLANDMKSVLKILIEWGKENGNDGVWKGYDWLADETGISIKKLRDYMKALLHQKIVTYGYLVNDDNQPCGKGYIIAQNIWYYNHYLEYNSNSKEDKQ